MTSPYDVTYCANAECPFEECEIHLTRIKKFPPGQMVSIADYSGVCRRYIGWLIDRIEGKK